MLYTALLSENITKSNKSFFKKVVQEFISNTLLINKIIGYR